MITNELHLKAPGDWINDPNGFIYFNGMYHLFYQYFPYGPRWGTMHWGHAVSADLVHWEHIGIALFPTKPYDRNGVFSGSAIEKDGKMNVYYTAELYGGINEYDIHLPDDSPSIQSQAMIVSEDGITFDNYNGKKVIIPPVEDTEIGDPADCRDPKVWKCGNKYYMVLGSTHHSETGVLVLYRSDDAENWEYLNRVQDKSLGRILECPDLFKVDGQWLLVCSPIGITSEGKGYESQATVRCVDFNPNTGEVTLRDEYGYLDYGLDIYAPQSNIDEMGRRVVISWVRMPAPKSAKTNSAAQGKDWNGVMTLPRVVEVVDGRIYTRVHPNVRNYFANAESEPVTQDGIHGRRVGNNTEITTRISEGEEICINDFIISMKDGCIVTDRSRLMGEYENLHMISKTPYIGTCCNLEIYDEPDIIEIYINDGLYVITNVK